MPIGSVLYSQRSLSTFKLPAAIAAVAVVTSMRTPHADRTDVENIVGLLNGFWIFADIGCNTAHAKPQVCTGLALLEARFHLWDARVVRSHLRGGGCPPPKRRLAAAATD